MNTSQSFSDDENDVYIDSAACLTALKQQTFKELQEKFLKDEKDEDNIVPSIPIIISPKSGKRPYNTRRNRAKSTNNPESSGIQRFKKTANHQRNVDLDTDLEIISITDASNRSDVINEDLTENDDVIVLCEENSESNDEEDYDVDIKVQWRSKRIHRFSVHRHENFTKVFEHFAELENVSVKQILIMRKDKRIVITDTPASLGLSVIDILEGGIVHPDTVPDFNLSKNDEAADDVCNIKVQTGAKQTLIIPLKNDQQFETVFLSCAEKLGLEYSSIKLYFDGDLITSTDTPESLDLEQEACVDLRVSKN